MSFISRHVRQRLDEAGARVFFVSGAVTKWYNARRSDPKTQVCLLGGWYWTLGKEERGPFRTPSAAERDVYYRRVLKTEPPNLNERDIAEAQREIQKEIEEERAMARRKKRARIAEAV